jgi:hypothetical protein
MAREAANPRHHLFHLLRQVCRKTSAVHSTSIMTTSIPVRQRSVASRHQGNSEPGCKAFRVTRHTELSHMGTGLPSLSTLQSLLPHCYSIGRFHTTSSPLSTRPQTSSDLFQRQQDTHTASLQLIASHDGQRPSPFWTLQPKPWYAPSWPAGYHVLVACRPSPPTRDVSLSHNSSSPWPNYAEFNFPGQPPTFLQPTD